VVRIVRPFMMLERSKASFISPSAFSSIGSTLQGRRQPRTDGRMCSGRSLTPTLSSHKISRIEKRMSWLISKVPQRACKRVTKSSKDVSPGKGGCLYNSRGSRTLTRELKSTLVEDSSESNSSIVVDIPLHLAAPFIQSKSNPGQMGKFSAQKGGQSECWSEFRLSDQSDCRK
jgi:hypothetical protein